MDIFTFLDLIITLTKICFQKSKKICKFKWTYGLSDNIVAMLSKGITMPSLKLIG